ncbi:MAG: ATP-binding protein [Geobacteraceae bacterium]|nr:ATP-binding protein [Geobacteraceae bacterium]
MTEKFQISIKPEFKSAETVRTKVKSTLDGLLSAVSEEKVDEFCQAVSELINNAIEHGHCSNIECELKVENEKAVFTLDTDGVLFDPTSVKARMPDFDERNELPEGGYGLAIIIQLSDEFTYRNEGNRNITVVTKIIGKSV